MAGTLRRAARRINSALPFGWRLVNVHSPLEHVARRGPKYAYLSPDAAIVTLHDGHLLYVDPQDESVSAHLIARGVWEIWVDQAVRNLVRRGDRVIEVGANVGYFTLLMAATVTRSGHILSFEANPHLADLLRRSLSLNGYLDRVDLRAEAASDHMGEIDFVTCRRSNGGGHILEGAGDFGADTIRIRAPAVRIDAVAGDAPIQFLRMDAEGAEPLVLKGAEATIARSPDLRICMEWDVVQMAARISPGELAAWLASQGFRFWRIEQNTRLTPVSAEALPGLPHSDLVLSRKGHPFRL